MEYACLPFCVWISMYPNTICWKDFEGIGSYKNVSGAWMCQGCLGAQFQSFDLCLSIATQASTLLLIHYLYCRFLISGLGQVVWNKKCIFNIPKYTRLLRPCLFQGIAGIPHHGLGFLSPSGSSLYNPDVLVLSLSAFLLSAFCLSLSPYLTNTAFLSSICMATSLTRLWDWWTCLRAPPRLKPTFIL